MLELKSSITEMKISLEFNSRFEKTEDCLSKLEDKII